MTLTRTFDELAAAIIKITENAPTAGGPKIVGIGGYPLTGKTRLALNIAARWPRQSFVLPTESVIAARRERLAAGHDGSSADAHDIQALADYISALRRCEPVTVPRYSWFSGRPEGLLRSPALSTGDVVILDGSIATAYPVRLHVDVAFALRPVAYDAWLRQAVDRDVSERRWPASLAHLQNVAKASTVERQLDGFGGNEFQQILNVRMAGGTWLVTDA
jgi:uridine kinase